MEIKIRVSGIVRQDDIQGWYIKVLDDTEGSTGGYYILQSKNPDFTGGIFGGVFDDWVVKERLEKYFQEANWVVEWLD